MSTVLVDTGDTFENSVLCRLAAADASVRNEATEQASHKVAQLISRFGGSSSNVLLDPRCRHYWHPGICGVIGHKRKGRYAVMLGDPVCAAADRPALLEAFNNESHQLGLKLIYAVIGETTAAHVRSQGWGLIEFGIEQRVDPQNSLSAPGYKDLRKKLKRAGHAGVQVAEYLPEKEGRDSDLERQMDDLAGHWLSSRKGLQTFWAHVDLFRARSTTRWFCASVDGKLVGVLSALRLEGAGGYLFEHILWLPDAPVGTSEALVSAALKALGAEGCRYASFGPAPAERLGELSGLPRFTRHSCRALYGIARHLFHLDAKTLHRRKYRPVAAQPLYLAFEPDTLTPGAMAALGHAFNFSLA